MGKNETIALNLYSPWVNYNRFAVIGYVLNELLKSLTDGAKTEANYEH